MELPIRLTPDALQIPADRENNFWYVRPSPSTDVTIVFLHGIFSSSRKCWLYEGTEARGSHQTVFWPDLVRQDTRLGSPAIYLAGYYTSPEAGDFPIAQCAKQVMDALGRPDLDRTPAVLDSKALVFVCHSMGGIMARYLIEGNKELFRKKAVGLALIASPSLGSSWADFGSVAAKYYNHRLAQQLKPNSDALKELHGRFRNLVDRRATEMPGLFGMEAAETKMIGRNWLPSPFRWLFPNRHQVVTTLSAGQYFGEVRSLPDTDHSSIVKPHGVNHPAHEFLVTFMLRFRQVIAELHPNDPVGLAPTPDSTPRTPVPSSVAATGVLPGGTMGHVPPAIGMTSLATQMTQIVINLPQPPSSQSAPAPFSQGMDARVLAERAKAVFAQEGTPRPRLEELFEIVTDPDDVRKALFRTESAAGLSPYDAEYVNARSGEPDIQQTLETTLRESRGRLLVTGRQGIGKTREVAELAQAACARRWKVLVARDEGNSRLGPLADLPPGWSDATVLIVIDNIHSRVLTTPDDATPPYLGRLAELLRWFDSRLPGSVRVVATARDDPRFLESLGMVPDSVSWMGFSVVPLPVLTNDALERILTAFATTANIPVDAALVPQLIENSDKMPQTMFINVDIARRQRRRDLRMEWWNPIEGETWKLRLVSAQANHPGVERVCQALRLLMQAGIPARLRYVVALAASGAEFDPVAAAKALVGEGLLGQRQGVLLPLSTDQLNDYLGKTEGLGAFLSRTDTIEQAIIEPGDRPKEWMDDLLAFAASIARAGALDRAEQVASRAIDLSSSPRAYAIRAGIRIQRRELGPAEADLTTAIDAGGDDAQILFLRGALRNLLGKFDDALADLSAAVQLGRDDSVVHMQLATSHYQQMRWPDVEKELSLAIARDESSGHTYFMRGIARLQLEDTAGAEHDFSNALERSVDFEAMTGQLRAFSSGEPMPLADSRERSRFGEIAGAAMIRLQRGIARLALNRYADAEDDLTFAIENGASAEFGKFAGDLEASALPMLASAKQHLAPAQLPLIQAAPFRMRGVARLNQGKFKEAENDFSAAIDRGDTEADVYRFRALTRLGLDNAVGVDADASTVIDEKRTPDAVTYGIRAIARVALGRLPEGEDDATKSIDLGGNSPPVFAARGNARLQQSRMAEADEDLSRALTLGPDAFVHFHRGCARLELGRFEESEADFTAALELGLHPAALFSFRGLARLSQRKTAEADQDATTAFELGATDVAAYSLRAWVRLERKQFPEAELDFTEAEKLGRRDAWLFSKRGRARERLRQYERAEQDFERVIAMQMADESVWLGRGNARLMQGNAAGAVEDLTAAVAAGRDDAIAHLLMAQALVQLRRYREAEAECELALARSDDVAARMLRGLTRLALAKFVGAEEDYTKALEAEPELSDNLHQRGMARFGRGDIPGALADYDRALSLTPDSLSFRGSRVLACVWLGDLEAATRGCEALQAAAGDDVETIGAWGVLELERGELDAAKRRFAAATQKDQVWGAFHGLACLVAGELDEARRAYEEAFAASAPGNVAFAINELDRCLNRGGVPTTAEVRAAAAAIRTRLVEAVGAVDSAGAGGSAQLAPV